MDDELWRKFKEEVFRKHGSLRKLSDEVEELLRSTLTGEALQVGLQKLGTKVTGVISSEQVKTNRPSLRGPPPRKLFVLLGIVALERSYLESSAVVKRYVTEPDPLAVDALYEKAETGDISSPGPIRTGVSRHMAIYSSEED